MCATQFVVSPTAQEYQFTYKSTDLEEIQHTCRAFTNFEKISKVQFEQICKKMIDIFKSDLFKSALEEKKASLTQQEEALRIKVEADANQTKFTQAEVDFNKLNTEYVAKFTRFSEPEETAPFLEGLFKLSNELEELRPYMEEQSKSFEKIKRFKTSNTSPEDYQFRIVLARTNRELLNQLTTLEPMVKSWERMNSKMTEMLAFAVSHWKTHPALIEAATSIDSSLQSKYYISNEIKNLKREAQRIRTYAAFISASQVETPQQLLEILEPKSGMVFIPGWTYSEYLDLKSYGDMAKYTFKIKEDLEKGLNFENIHYKELQRPFKVFIDDQRDDLKKQYDAALKKLKVAWEWQKGLTSNPLSTEGLTVYLQRFASAIAKKHAVEPMKIVSPFAKDYKVS